MTSEPVRLDTALPGDAEAILAAHHAAVRGTARAFYAPGVVEAWAPFPIRPERVAALAARIALGEEAAVVARAADGRVVGFGSIVAADSELRAVYVDPAHGRSGVGGMILGELEARARGQDLVELRMDASLNAEAFYLRHGYEALGHGEHVLGSGVRMACVRMRKALRPGTEA